MLSFLLSGWFLLRTDARRFVELLFHEPPRRLDRTPLSMIHGLALPNDLAGRNGGASSASSEAGSARCGACP